MPSITRKEMIEALEDIQELIMMDSPIEVTDDMTMSDIVEELNEKQDGPDRFEDGDFLPGEEDSLKIKTVRILKRKEVTIPIEWEPKLDLVKKNKIADWDGSKAKPKQKAKEQKADWEKEPEKKKQDPAPKEKAAPKPPKKKAQQEVNWLGHRLSGNNPRLDEDMLEKPFTVDDLQKKGWKRYRVNNHVYHLKNDKSDLVDVKKEGKVITITKKAGK